MIRLFESLLKWHFSDSNKIAIVTGPRQCGKTTVCQSTFPRQLYLSWDNADHRKIILDGPSKISETMDSEGVKVVLFDEMHKYPDWKNWLKGFFDTYAVKYQYKIVVTGSAKLDYYKKGSDSLLGRYFPYRLHPLSLREIVAYEKNDNLINQPVEISDENYNSLLLHGAFPEPFIKKSKSFTTRWKNVRRRLLINEDLRDLSVVHEIKQLEILADMIRHQAANQVNYSNLAVKIRASEDSIRRWMSSLESIYYCFTIKPWSNNISRSLIKMPKAYLWDWSDVVSAGAQKENMVACHLLKAVHWWTDIGLGEFDLCYLRNKEGMEVDFIVIRDGSPWFLVEVKSSMDEPLSSRLEYFQRQTEAKHAFQVVVDAPYIEQDCFAVTHPIKVSARTFLSQLV